MKHKAYVLIGLAAVLSLSAEETKEPLEARRSARPATKRAATDSSLSTFGVCKNFTIAPGQVYTCNFPNDYTGADRISIALECPSGNPLKNVQLVVWWGIPIADWLTATDVILGSNFTFNNQGGAVVAVFGPTLSVDIRNSGTIPVTCDQITTYAVVH